MPVLAEQAIHAIYILSLVIFLFTVALIVFALVRRKIHESYYRELDNLRRQCRPIIEAVLDGSIPYDAGLAELKARSRPSHAGMLERILVEVKPPASQSAMFEQISWDLGLIRAWQEGLATPAMLSSEPNAARSRSGSRRLWRWPGFPNRAKAAEYLGMLRHRPSWRLMVRAMND
ncbi:MAG: hypothetical protein ACREP9_22355, partial [Candidatus Dormibacteraceae bacterium]